MKRKKLQIVPILLNILLRCIYNLVVVDLETYLWPHYCFNDIEGQSLLYLSHLLTKIFYIFLLLIGSGPVQGVHHQGDIHILRQTVRHECSSREEAGRGLRRGARSTRLGTQYRQFEVSYIVFFSGLLSDDFHESPHLEVDLVFSHFSVGLSVIEGTF